VCLITNGSDTHDATGDGSDSDSDDGEPENKRPRFDSYEVALAALELPRTYKEAIAMPDSGKWREAKCSEIRSHMRNHTWDLVTRPRGVKVIGNKWVFAHKYDEHRNITRYKARLVAHGFLQTHTLLW
jgi:hypothetical protein